MKFITLSIMLSFITNGNFIDFKEIEVPSIGKPELYTHQILKLHKTARAINWTYDDNPNTISFTIDERKYSNIPISTIQFDGVAMSVQTDFETKVKLMFPGLAGGGLPYLLYQAEVTQASNKTSGTLTIGVRYTIDQLQAGDNFTNVGYVTDQVEFIATGTTPTTWTHATVVIPTPIVSTVVYNSYNSIPFIVRSSVGLYRITSPNIEFIQNKTFTPPFGGRSQIVNMNIFGNTNGFYEVFPTTNSTYVFLANASDTLGTPVEMNAIVGDSQFKLFVTIQTYP